MRLPAPVANLQPVRSEILALRGLNWSDSIADGDLQDCENLSARRYPYFSTRNARKRLENYAGCTALTARGKLVAVAGSQVLYDGMVVGAVTPGEKQFAVVNTKLVIWPDKVYLDLDTLIVRPMTADMTVTGVTFTTDTMTVTGGGSLSGAFQVGDCVTLSGGSVAANNKDVVIKAISPTTLTVEANGFTAGEGGSVRVQRRVPDLDFICESQNRLWGCSSADRTIYASALGDPTNFYVYQGLSTDSYAVAVGSEGDFTGCCRLSTSVLFWKETCLHKLLGSYPAEYAVYTYEIEGLKRECHKSMQVINEVLYYQGVHGIYAFSGGTPSLISQRFGNRELAHGSAGTDGERYFLSCLEGGAHTLLTYDTKTGLWLREDDTEVVDFARVGKELFFLKADGTVWLADTGEEDPDLDWSMTFTPFYDVMARKRLTRLLLRLQLPKGSWAAAEVRFDGSLWRQAGKVVGRREDTVPLCVPIARCDRAEIRIRGNGPCTLLAVQRTFQIGSDR